MPKVALTHAGGVAAGAASFTRLFQRSVPALPERVLEALASTMKDEKDDVGPLPAGYTYLGQFIDHDLVADPRRFMQPAQSTLLNDRTPRLDLDSVYGDGPSGDPDLYNGTKLRLDQRDFARNQQGVAFVKDTRNDSNLILSQLHVAFARFHNEVANEISDFDTARQVVCRHYQWMVLNDYLPKIVGTNVLTSILGRTGVRAAANLRCYRLGPYPTIPLEFSAAAFRFGHSMVRSIYQLRRDGETLPLFVEDSGVGTMPDLRGFREVPPKRQIQWSRFFGSASQRAKPIDPFVVAELFRLPKEISNDDTPLGRSLPYRNLYRCERDLGLPTGQDVVRAMRQAGVPGAWDKRLGVEIKIKIARTPDAHPDLAGTGVSVRELTDVLNESTPLWYYVLAEAAQSGGPSLGFVGGRIVAETFIGLMLGDPTSILNTGWKPEPGQFGCSANGHFGIAELLSYAVPD